MAKSSGSNLFILSGIRATCRLKILLSLTRIVLALPGSPGTAIIASESPANVLNAAYLPSPMESPSRLLTRRAVYDRNPSTVAKIDNPEDFNPNKWEETVSRECTTVIKPLMGQKTNPSGLAGCYNIPLYDRISGIFEADLRLYNVSPPFGTWTDVVMSKIDIVVTADKFVMERLPKLIPMVREKSIHRRAKQDFKSSPSGRSNSSTEVAVKSLDLQPVSTTYYLGQIDPKMISRESAKMVEYFFPNISVMSNMPHTMLPIVSKLDYLPTSFVAGNFRPERVEVAVADAPFVLPGVRIKIVPIGFAITLLWSVLFLGNLLNATAGRYKSRTSYRD